jgi:Predicted membrane protein
MADNNEYVKDYEKRLQRVVNDYEHTIVEQLNNEYSKQTRWPDKLADRIAAFGGSWSFILVFAAFLVTWILVNTLNFIRHFDSPPFILLNLILSFIAAFQAPIIMMSQNRQAAREKRESIIDFAINYKAELEVDDIQAHLHRIEKEMANLKAILQERNKQG